ncbi:hypothetical protein AGDE_13540 [Angomonas deanei]|uniref:Mitochondrial carrier protein, putative n=1 Tax=Angomonas deanei TaxID=59799 RepID=A0A7G2CER5_9TRYP|nr:hypothetical protein AGDE_13540 [Angomonas deanei]CAD2217354.1 Mitochondrial carrier protein, putative [Angomonas deanei]|eukprot:EPY22197.1 hypothetical protein AGDE_13540 [Angomonas deanei]
MQDQLLLTAIRYALRECTSVTVEYALRLGLPVVVCLLTAPLRNIRKVLFTNLTVGLVAEPSKDDDVAPPYHSVWEVWRALRESVPLSSLLWRGMGIEVLDRYVGLATGLALPPVLRSLQEYSSLAGLPPLGISLLSSALFCVTSVLVHAPHFVLTHRLALLSRKTEGGDDVGWRYASTTSCVKDILHREGVSGFFRGAWVAVGCQFVGTLPIIV